MKLIGGNGAARVGWRQVILVGIDDRFRIFIVSSDMVKTGSAGWLIVIAVNTRLWCSLGQITAS
jgi:hypothetical protein